MLEARVSLCSLLSQSKDHRVIVVAGRSFSTINTVLSMIALGSEDVYLLEVGSKLVNDVEDHSDRSVDLLALRQVVVHRLVGVDGASLDDVASPNDDQDRKSTRLNSSHVTISYAVFCL